MRSLFTGRRRQLLRTLAGVFVPETAQATRTQWDALETLVESALAERTPSERRQLVLFLRALALLTRVRFGRGLGELDALTRTAWLERLADSRLRKLRRGIWGLRTLILLGWYGQPEVSRALGYRASAAGWNARQSRQQSTVNGQP